jgi:integrase
MRKGRYYYDTQGKPRRELPLGADYGTALAKWAELEGGNHSTLPTFGHAAKRYMTEVLPTKAPRTQADNEKEMANLLKVFADAPLGQIKPAHVRGYMDTRGKAAKIRANREKALFSHVFNKSREWGLTDAPNPSAGVKGFTEQGRDKYVEDAEFRAVYCQACIPLRNAMDLAYLASQRPADTLKTTIFDIASERLKVRQNKTGKKLRIAIEGRLKALIDSLMPRRTGLVVCPHLIRNEDDQPFTYSAMVQRFQNAREAAIQAAQDAGSHDLAASLRTFQFRDLRAKGASDMDDLGAAQSLLGHESRSTTEIYIRARQGDKVRPVK